MCARPVRLRPGSGRGLNPIPDTAMSDGFDITVSVGLITVTTEAFRLVFNRSKVGITSFEYQTNGTWHEAVESGTIPPLLFCPYFTVQGLSGDVLYPSGGTELKVEKYLGRYLEISQSGYMRNASISSCIDYPVEIIWRLWPSGRLCCKVSVENQSGSSKTVTEEAYRLNPADDQDMDLSRDAEPNLDWFGFWSNNTGSDGDDLSHDAIVVPMVSGLTGYGTDGNTNRIYRGPVVWPDGGRIGFEFLLALSVGGSWGDCTDSGDFQSRGDAISADVLNPDPLDGSGNAGEVLVGGRVGDGFDEDLAAYTLSVSGA